jgi:hypothetical protein
MVTPLIQVGAECEDVSAWQRASCCMHLLQNGDQDTIVRGLKDS